MGAENERENLSHAPVALSLFKIVSTITFRNTQKTKIVIICIVENSDGSYILYI